MYNPLLSSLSLLLFFSCLPLNELIVYVGERLVVHAKTLGLHEDGIDSGTKLAPLLALTARERVDLVRS